MKIPASYFYVDYSKSKDPAKAQIWPLCLECGKKWPGAMHYTGAYGPWEYRCHNPLCPTPGGKLIWEGGIDSTV